MKLSKAEQDYIKAIYEFQTTENTDLVSLKQLVERLQVSAPTVTEMVKRMEKKDLIIYKSYRGVSLTEFGMKEASFILKAHRVWEYFLLKVLKYQEDDVHDEAEALEHATTPQLLERLYTYLGKPEVCPHGQQIPQEVFWYEAKDEMYLADLPVGTQADVLTFSEETKQYFKKVNAIQNPTTIKCLDRFSDNTMLVELDYKMQIVLPAFFQKDFSVIVYR